MQNVAEPREEDEDQDGRIWPALKLTAYDRRRNELRELEAKRDAILAKAEITAEDRARLVKLSPLIESAKIRFDREGERAKDDLWRKRRSIDEWRAGEGREQRNQSRRKVRAEPNADLSELTPEQKKQRKLDQTADSRWLKRCRDKGWSEAKTQAELAARIRAREAKRADKAEMDAEDEEYESAMAEIRARSIMS